MKKLIYFLVLFVFVLSSCDKGFEEMNVNPTKPSQLSPAVKMTTTQMYTAGKDYVATLFYHVGVIMPIMQQLNCTTYRWEYTDGQDYRFFEEQYKTSVKAVVDLVDGLENSDDPNATIDLAIANVWKVLVFSRLTDAYGDIPYSEAGKAYIDGIRFPKYDTQEFIYSDMLNLLETSSNALAAGGTSSYGNGDVVFNGDVAKWRKFANSLMLRLAMRMVNVNETGAREWAIKAIAGGVMESNEDIAYMNFESVPGYGGIFGPTINPITRAIGSRYGKQIKLSDTFVDFMQERNDPRVSVLGSTYTGDTTPGLQIGQANIDRTRAASNSRPNANVFGGLVGWSWYRAEGNYDAPFFFQTYAEVELMLAEVATRWGVAPSNAGTHYNNGVEAAMSYLDLYEYSQNCNTGEASISQSQINAYLAANPFDAASALEMINEQYWIATFPNGLETWANWKRSGYPALVPVLHSFSISPNGDIPRRFTYPSDELATNAESVQEAINRQGDEMNGRVWWDVD